MGTLDVRPYDLTEVAAPPGSVEWSFDLDRAALLVHDVQRYFVRPFDPSMRRDLLAGVGRLQALFRASGAPVLFSAQPGGMTPAERGLLHRRWGPGMSSAETDRGICAEVAPLEGEVVLTKWRYSAFFRSDLAERLRDRGRTQLVVCGVYAAVGIQATLVDAFSRDIEPFLAVDAVADFSRSAHESAAAYAAAHCAQVVRVASLAGAGVAA